MLRQRRHLRQPSVCGARRYSHIHRCCGRPCDRLTVAGGRLNDAEPLNDSKQRYIVFQMRFRAIFRPNIARSKEWDQGRGTLSRATGSLARPSKLALMPNGQRNEDG